MKLSSQEHSETVQVVTTGATTRSSRGVVILTERDTTYSATQVGPRPVESGLGRHKVGVFGVDGGVKTTSHPLWKRVGTAMSQCGTFSCYAGRVNEGTLIN